MNIKAYTKQILANSLLELFKYKDLENIKISEICENCDVCRKTFYNHFKDKYDLMSWILIQKHNEFFRQQNFYQENLKNYLESIKSDHAFYRRLFANPDMSGLLGYFVSANIINLESAYNIHEEHLHVLSEFYILGFVFTIREWILSGFRIDTETLAQAIYESFPDALHEHITSRSIPTM